MAIAATYVVSSTAVTTGSSALYTVPSSTSSSYGTYARDLVLTNSGTASIFVSLGSGSTSAATTSSFQIPTGGSVVLTQCQVPAGGIVYAIGSAASTLSIGYGSVVSVV